MVIAVVGKTQGLRQRRDGIAEYQARPICQKIRQIEGEQNDAHKQDRLSVEPCDFK